MASIPATSGAYKIVQKVQATVGVIPVGTTVTVSLPVAGADIEDCVSVFANRLTDSGMGIVGAYCATAGTVSVKVMNINLAGPTTPVNDPITFRVVIL